MRGLEINWANQVWCTAMISILMTKGFMSRTAFIDAYWRKMVGWVPVLVRLCLT
jgi:hypothetical protein